MKIVQKEFTVRDLFDGFQDSDEEGVVGLRGRLDIRPPFQREFVYKDDKRDAVIDTVLKDFPLNVFYFSVTGTDPGTGEDTYEVLDGQQRIMSLCRFLETPGGFSITDPSGETRYFHTLSEDEQDQILDYALQVYVCDGSDDEKLEWFKTINVAGERLNAQELRNAVFAGPWLSDAKKKFSKSGCAAYHLARTYVKGSPIRQDFLQTALEWIAHRDGVTIEEAMAARRDEDDAQELWSYFRGVTEWVTDTFVVYRREMKGVNWGALYNEHAGTEFDVNALEDRITALMEDDDVTRKASIYEYVLSGAEKALGIRDFTPSMSRDAYARQEGACAHCGTEHPSEKLTATHAVAWVNGGTTSADNCDLICADCLAAAM